MTSVKTFIDENFKHFNASTLRNASKAYKSLVDSGGKMVVTLGGAMSTAEIGRTLAAMIRQEKVHFISCTGANLEEDLMKLIAFNSYVKVDRYQDLTPQDEKKLCDKGLNRVTDVCIPEKEAIRELEAALLAQWNHALEEGVSKLPHEYLLDAVSTQEIKGCFQGDSKNSWVLAAIDKKIPIVVPGWEDSTFGNIFTSHCIRNPKYTRILKPGIEYMIKTVNWYMSHCRDKKMGMFQIGGGIAGDFPVCAVPLIEQDLNWEAKKWSYFCQISDSTTSYGSYSGAHPNEKISWGKLDEKSESFSLESDATIVVPLVFAYVMDL